MNNTTVNFSTPETSLNSTTTSIGTVVICVLSINVLFGVPANIYIIWLIVTGTRSGVASEFVNLNLSVCEIGVCLNYFLNMIKINFSVFLFLSRILQGLALTGRPLFQCLMCFERYLAVVHPVTFLKYKPLRYRLICCAVAWVIILGGCLCCMFIFITENGYAFACLYFIQFLLFLSIQLFCLVAVLRALKQSGPGERKREKEENHMKRRAFQIILITSVSMVIAYVPYIITGLITLLSQGFFQTLWLSTLICYVLASFVHPVLYLQRYVKLFRLCSFIMIHTNLCT